MWVQSGCIEGGVAVYWLNPNVKIICPFWINNAKGLQWREFLCCIGTAFIPGARESVGDQCMSSRYNALTWIHAWLHSHDLYILAHIRGIYGYIFTWPVTCRARLLWLRFWRVSRHLAVARATPAPGRGESSKNGKNNRQQHFLRLISPASHFAVHNLFFWGGGGGHTCSPYSPPSCRTEYTNFVFYRQVRKYTFFVRRTSPAPTSCEFWGRNFILKTFSWKSKMKPVVKYECLRRRPYALHLGCPSYVDCCNMLIGKGKHSEVWTRFASSPTLKVRVYVLP